MVSGNPVSAHRPEIDGLRAFAVLPVILFHAGFEVFSGGFVGVDVFFVISGFLITNLLLTEMQTGRFSITAFYERRARRILPALFFVALACVPFAWTWMPESDFREFSFSLISVPTFVSNVQFWLEAGYFTSENKPLLHTWSLAVEEQFYILFPVFLLVLMRAGRKFACIAVVTVVIASLGLSEWGARYKPSANFYLLPSRIWELGAGALAAFLGARSRSVAGEFLAICGMTAVVASVFIIDGDMPFPATIALLPVGGTALVLVFATSGTIVQKTLSIMPVVFVGLISYSAYLIHHPVFAFARRQGLDPQDHLAFAGLALASLALAALVWRFVEQPFRNRNWLSRGRVFLLALAGSGVVAAAGISGLVFSGAQHDLYRATLTPQARINADMIARSGIGRFDDGRCRFWNIALNDDFYSRFDACSQIHGKAVVVMGDSHGRNIFNALAGTSGQPFMVGVVQGGCRPHDRKPRCYFDRFEKFVARRQDRIERVIFHQSGSYFISDDRGKVDSSRAFRDGIETEIAMENVDRVIAYLDDLGGLVETVWLGPFAEYRDRRNVYRLQSQIFNPNSVPQFDALDRALIERIGAPGSRRFRYVSLHRHLAPLYGLIVLGDCLTVRDMDHWSHCGEKLVGEIIRDSGLLE